MIIHTEHQRQQHEEPQLQQPLPQQRQRGHTNRIGDITFIVTIRMRRLIDRNTIRTSHTIRNMITVIECLQNEPILSHRNVHTNRTIPAILDIQPKTQIQQITQDTIPIDRNRILRLQQRQLNDHLDVIRTQINRKHAIPAMMRLQSLGESCSYSKIV